MPKITKTRGYTIGQVSRRSGVNIETIRYYERVGIMPEPGRTRGGNRQYDHEQLKRLAFVRRSRELGFSLAEIRALLNMVDHEDFTCAQVHEMTIAHLSTVRDKISGLRRLEKALKSMADECSKGDLPVCPIIDTLFDLA